MVTGFVLATTLFKFYRLMHLQIASLERLLDRLDPVPVAREQQSTALAPDRDAEHIGRAGFPIVLHLEL